MPNTEPKIVTAAILVIGDEVLSGRTKDKNIGTIADYMTAIGIDVREVRIVPDVETEIVDALNALRGRYGYVFTTGGIGPTHDDITADCVAKAFGVSLDIREDAVEALRARYPEMDLTPSRLRMARIPDGAVLIDNPVSGAPGFRIGNVCVMAGVPKIMRGMLDQLTPTLEGGTKLVSETRTGRVRESDISGPLGALQKTHPEVMLGSYPGIDDHGHFVSVVARARETVPLGPVIAQVEAILEDCRYSEDAVQELGESKTT
jgi:molybdenum cofactor synthesis domain-containing protein